MKKIIKENQPFERIVVSRDEAIRLANEGQLGALGPRPMPSKFKLDILLGIPDEEEISLYRNGDFTDLCAGPHVMRTGNIGAFKLTSIASAYYKRDANNPQLQRVYGTAFKTRSRVGPLLCSCSKKPKNEIIVSWVANLNCFISTKRSDPDWCSGNRKAQSFERNFRPLFLKSWDDRGIPKCLRRTSGNWPSSVPPGIIPYYSDSQFPPLIEPETLAKFAEEGCSCAELSNRLKRGEIEGYLLKPMNCPMHIKIYASGQHSYRDLPIRLGGVRDRLSLGTIRRTGWDDQGSGLHTG